MSAQKKHSNQAEGSGNIWTSFSDLFTSLSVIFLVMFIIAILKGSLSTFEQFRTTEEFEQERQAKEQAFKEIQQEHQKFLEGKVPENVAQDIDKTKQTVINSLSAIETQKSQLNSRINEISDLVASLDEHKLTVAKILEEHAKKEAVLANVEEVISKKNDELKRRETEIEKKRQEIEQVYKEKQKEIKELHQQKLKLTDTLVQANEQSESQKVQHQQRVDELEKQHSKTQARLKSELEAKLSELETTLENERSQFSQQIEAQRSEFESTLANAKSASEQTLNQTKNDYENTINQQKSDYEGKLNSKNSEYESALAESQKDFNDTLQKQKSQLGETIAKQGAEIAELQKALEAEKSGKNQEIHQGIATGFREALANRLNESLQAAGSDVQANPNGGITIYLEEDFLFNKDSADLRTGVKQKLREVVPIYLEELLGNKMIRNSIESINIIGHASPRYASKPVDPKSRFNEAYYHNLKLSTNRAMEVTRFVLSDDFGDLSRRDEFQERARVSGMSYMNPVGLSDEERDNLDKGKGDCGAYSCKRSRRVEINFSLKENIVAYHDAIKSIQ